MKTIRQDVLILVKWNTTKNRNPKVYFEDLQQRSEKRKKLFMLASGNILDAGFGLLWRRGLGELVIQSNSCTGNALQCIYL